jgi:Txe/YoeB family toxin of Txe-Axe toxin-antitoxin module
MRRNNHDSPDAPRFSQNHCRHAAAIDTLGTTPKMLKKSIQLCLDACDHPTQGLGKPEALKHDFQGLVTAY